MSELEHKPLWQQLQTAGVVAVDQAEPHVLVVQEAPRDSWAVRSVAGIGGLWAGGFVISFFTGLFSLVFKEAWAHALLSAACLGAAAVLYRVSAAHGSVFRMQFALSFSLAGQGLALMAALGWHWKASAVAAAMALVQIVLLIGIAQTLHRTLCTLLLGVCLAVMAREISHVVLALAVVTLAVAWLWRQSLACRVQFDCLHAGATLAMLMLAVVLVLEDRVRIASWLGAFNPHAVRVLAWVCAAALWVDVCRQLVARHTHSVKQGAFLYVLPLAVGLALPSLLLCLAMAVMALALHRKALAWLAALTAVAVVALYYYGRQTSLWVKSIEMFVAGALLLMAWAWLRWTGWHGLGHKEVGP